MTAIRNATDIATGVMLTLWEDYHQNCYLDAWGAVELERWRTGDPSARPREMEFGNGGGRSLSGGMGILELHADVSRVLPAIERKAVLATKLLQFRHCVDIETTHILFTFEDGTTALLTRYEAEKAPPQKACKDISAITARPQRPWTEFEPMVPLLGMLASWADVLELEYFAVRERIGHELGLSKMASECVRDGRQLPAVLDQRSLLSRAKKIEKSRTVLASGRV